MDEAPKPQGKRYTTEERARILEYADTIDGMKGGRGGLTAPHQKFGVSVLTVATWRRKVGTSEKKTRARAGMFKALAALNERIIKTETLLRGLRRKYDLLVGKL